MIRPFAVYEFHLAVEHGVDGWRGWQVFVEDADTGEEWRYSFDEREGVATGPQAIATVFSPERLGPLAAHGADLRVSLRETRIVVSAEICPN